MEPMKTITLDGVTYEITDAQARATLQQIVEGLPTVDEQMRNAFTKVQNDIGTSRICYIYQHKNKASRHSENRRRQKQNNVIQLLERTGFYAHEKGGD